MPGGARGQNQGHEQKALFRVQFLTFTLDLRFQC